MLSNRTLNVGEGHDRYFGQLYQKFGEPLRRDFLSQMESDAEATECLLETFNYFFEYMEGRPWEKDEKLIRYRLRMIAAGVCTKRLAEKSALAAQGLARQEQEEPPLNRFKHEVLRPARVRSQFVQTLLQLFAGVRRPEFEQLSALR